MNLNHSEFLVSLSVCWLAYFLTEIMSIEGYLQFWMRYLSGIFWRHVVTMVPNNSDFLYVCQSGSWHTSLLISGKLREISSSG